MPRFSLRCRPGFTSAHSCVLRYQITHLASIPRPRVSQTRTTPARGGQGTAEPAFIHWSVTKSGLSGRESWACFLSYAFICLERLKRVHNMNKRAWAGLKRFKVIRRVAQIYYFFVEIHVVMGWAGEMNATYHYSRSGCLRLRVLLISSPFLISIVFRLCRTWIKADQSIVAPEDSLQMDMIPHLGVFSYSVRVFQCVGAGTPDAPRDSWLRRECPCPG